MRRINANRKHFKMLIPGDLPIQQTKKTNLNFDILYILQKYTKNFFFHKVSLDHKFYRKDQISKLRFDQKIPDPLDFNLYVNLQEVFITKLTCLNLNVFQNFQFKKLIVSSTENILITRKIEVEELKLCNTQIHLTNLILLIKSKGLKSLNLTNVVIYTNNPSADKQLYDEVDSEEQVMQYVYDKDIENEYPNLEEEGIGLKISLALDDTLIKNITFINTNIHISSILNSKIIYQISKLKYVYKTRVLFLNYSIGIWTYFKGNYFKNINFTGIQLLDVCSGDIFYKDLNIKNMKCISITNCTISKQLITKIYETCPFTIEFTFVECNFTDVSFYLFLQLFKEKLRYFHTHRSVLPLDSQDYLKRNLRNCKIRFT